MMRVKEYVMPDSSSVPNTIMRVNALTEQMLGESQAEGQQKRYQPIRATETGP
jgi:hypothetical protein